MNRQCPALGTSLGLLSRVMFVRLHGETDEMDCDQFKHIALPVDIMKGSSAGHTLRVLMKFRQGIAAKLGAIC